MSQKIIIDGFQYCTYTGNLNSDNKPHGQGECLFTNGDTYNGNWDNGFMNGKGLYIYKNHDKYEGDWVKNKKNGQGTIIYTNLGTYKGEWIDDMRHGKGTFTYRSGDIYDGDWIDGMRHGIGKYFYTNRDTYEGEWLNDMKNGEGTYTYTNLGTYRGEWLNGRRHGKGTFTYRSGDIYNGDWIDGKMHGKGKYFYTNDDTYEGDWKNGMKNGYGTFFYKNGSKYLGNWQNDKKHGEGCFHSNIVESHKLCLTYNNDVRKQVQIVHDVSKDNSDVPKDNSMEYTEVDNIHLVAYYKNIHKKQILLIGEENDINTSSINTNKTSSLLDWLNNFKWDETQYLDLFVGSEVKIKDIAEHKNIKIISTMFDYILIDYNYTNYDFVNYYTNNKNRFGEIQLIFDNYKYIDKIINFFFTGRCKKYLVNLINIIQKSLGLPNSQTITEWAAEYSSYIKNLIRHVDSIIKINELKKVFTQIYDKSWISFVYLPMYVLWIIQLFTQIENEPDKKNVIMYDESKHIEFYITILNKYFDKTPTYFVHNFEHNSVDIPKSIP